MPIQPKHFNVRPVWSVRPSLVTDNLRGGCHTRAMKCYSVTLLDIVEVHHDKIWGK